MSKPVDTVAKLLLDLGAVSLSPKKPFKFASGILSPVYTDCRVLMAYPAKRSEIRDLYIDAIQKSGVKFDVVCGTATAGIPHAAWIADKLNLPMVYVRGTIKDHGKENLLEGIIKKGQKAIVIEDLISTGESAIQSSNAVRAKGGEVSYVFAIITYGIRLAEENFKKNNLKLITLTTFKEVVEIALNLKLLTEKEVKIVLDWMKNET